MGRSPPIWRRSTGRGCPRRRSPGSLTGSSRGWWSGRTGRWTRCTRWCSSTAIVVKIREGQVANRPIYVAVGVTVDGERDILGLWAGDGGEGAKYWQHVLTEIKNRGAADVCIAGLRRADRPARRGRARCGPRPSCKRVWSTCCATASATPAARTGRRSPRTSSRSTPPRPRRPPWSAWPSSPSAGRPSTRPSSSCGRTPGPSSCPS